ncbi:MAG: hypothetical protein DRO95_04750, partial [Candidatus Altiarchaeales archaeon]
MQDWVSANIYLENADGNTITNVTSSSSPEYGISIDYSSFNTLSNITANSNGWFGISFFLSSSNTLTNIKANSNRNGIYLHSSSSNTLSNITANSNDGNGILISWNSDNNIIANSTISNNTDAGLYLEEFDPDYPEYNKIYNCLFNNSVNVKIDSGITGENYFNTTKQPGTRIYSPGNEIGGNYWTNPSGNGYSDTCNDSDKDGFCDEPLNLSNGTSVAWDYLPLSDEYYVSFSITLNSPPNQTTTNDPTPDFNFTVSGTESSYSCELFINNTGYGNATANNNIATIITANSTLSDGTYNWKINCTAYDTSNVSETRTLIIDTTPPATTASAVKDDGSTYTFNTWTNSTYVNVTLSCDDGSGVGCDTTQYCIDTDNSCTPNLTYSTPVQISTEGISYIRFRSNDTAGNLESIKSEIIKIDTASPVLNFTSPTEPNGTTINRNWTEVNITIDESNLDTFKFNWNSTNYTFYDDSLVLALNFNNNSAIGENSTHAVDISKYGNDGTIYGATWTDGKFGKALSFDGVDDYVDCGNDSSLDITDAITIEAWIYDPPPEKLEQKGLVETLNLEELKIKQIGSDKFAFKSLSRDLIEIGEERHSPPQPYLKLNKWDGEVSLKVEVPYGRGAIRILEQNKLKYVSHKYDVNFYPKEPEEITEEIAGRNHTFKINEKGGVEFDVILKEKPDSNIFEFPIKTKGLKFYYQPPLHPAHPTWADTDGDGKADTFRPENVVGSYAVYHESKQGDYTKLGGKNYRAGKVFHIYRPKIIDNVGKEVWGKLNIDVGKKLLTIEIPQEFLDNAVYPVRIDPNFGYESKGASHTYLYNDIAGSWFTCPEDGTAENITAYHDDWGAGNEYAIYKKSDNSLVDHTESGTGQQSEGWYTFNFLDPKPSLSGGEDYWLVLWGTSNTYYWYDSATGKGGRQDDVSKWPDPWSPTSEDKIYSIYCTYTSAPTHNRIIVGKGRDAYQIEIDDDLNVIGYINNQTVSTQITKALHHIVLTYDKVNMRLYVDGVEKNSTAYNTAISTNTKSLKIGYLFNGTIDEIRIYNRALSAKEIKIHHLSEFQKYNSTQYRFYTNITNLTDGIYTYYGWANDTAGNSGESETRSLTVDAVSPYYISNCTTLNESGATYYLTADIINSSQSYCINISANNVTLDCQGHLIDGDDTAEYGIYISRDSQQITNITIRNCIVQDWATANVYLENADGNTIANVTSSSSPDDGIYLYPSDFNILSNITANSNSGYGIYLGAADSNTLSNITANSNSECGIYLGLSGSNNLRDITANSNQYGLYIDGSHYNNFINITANSNSEYGMFIESSVSNTIQDSNLINNSMYDFYIYAFSDMYCDNQLIEVMGTDNKPIVYYNSTTTIENWDNNVSAIILCDADNSVINNVTLDHTDKKNNMILLHWTSNTSISNVEVVDLYYGVYLDSSDSNTLTNITANSNSNDGIYLDYSSLNTLTNITANSNRFGIHLHYSSSNTLTNITADSNSRYGIRIYWDSDNNIIANSTISNNANAGLYLDESGSFDPEYNKIYNCLFNNSVNVKIDSGITGENYFNTTKQPGTRIYSPGNEIGGNYWTNPS